MTRKYLTARREQNRQLAERDAANRCAHCKKTLTGWVEDFLEPGRFCDDECMEAANEARRMAREVKG